MNNLDTSLFAQAELLTQLVAEAIAPALAKGGLSSSTFALLSAISASDGRLTQAEVAKRLAVTPPTLSEAVKVGVKLGLLVQIPDTKDARVKRLELTAMGRSKAKEILKSLRQLEVEVLGSIDPLNLRVATDALHDASLNLSRLVQRRLN